MKKRDFTVNKNREHSKNKKESGSGFRLKKLRKKVRKAQDAKRYEHTLGVEYTAAALAMRYGADMEAAQAAGLLHDCAKCIPDDRKLKLCEKYGIAVTETERRCPFLLHSKLGGYLAREEYGIRDQDVINAIVNHTTGREDMSLLEKIVFVADYIEPGRQHAPNLPQIRALAFEDLDRALVRILEDTLEYLKDAEEELDPMTEITLKYYQPLVEGAWREHGQ